MTDTNRYGPGVSWRAVRRWALAGAGMWLPAYIRDAERQHVADGETLGVGGAGWKDGHAKLPITTRTASEPRKWPNEMLPALIIESPGLSDEMPERQADRTYKAEWIVALHGIVHGAGEDDTELLASVYGLALMKMGAQQMGGWADQAGYNGPALRVDSVRWEDVAFNEVVQEQRKRSVVAATATFTVVFRNVSSSMGGPTVPPTDPTVDPGDWPEIVQTELDMTREAL